MNLIIDIGNTYVKTAVFEASNLIFKETYSYSDWEINLNKIKLIFPNITNCVVSNVGKIENDHLKSVLNFQNLFFISKNTKFPFVNLYSTPNTLGIDRMVLASGAVLNFPTNNKLIIDAGTCITYDFVDNENKYFGGAISPGIQLRYQSLHNHTAKLPLLSKKIPESFIGNSTENAIHSGVINGVIHEINGTIASFSAKYENFIIILTGGDADFLAKRLKNTIFANSNFLLESLNQLFQFNQND
jgi:type III pantothenate kinase